MPIDAAAARTLAERYLRARFGDVAIRVDDAQTIERHFGWVFCYQSEAFLASGDIRDALIGNAPLIVDRDGALHLTGTGRSIEFFIEEFERREPRTAAAGWYADPAGHHARRWWDGQRWTSRVSDEPQPS